MNIKPAVLTALSIILFSFPFLSPKISADQVSTVEVNDIDLVSKTRSGRTFFDYSFQVTFTNTGIEVKDLIATVSSNSKDINVIDGKIAIGSLEAASSITSQDTVTLRIDRRTPFDISKLTWNFEGNISSNDTPPTEDDESPSNGVITSELVETQLYAAESDVLLSVTGAEFSTEPGEITLIHNEELVESIIVSKDSIRAPGLLKDGINNIVLYANDSDGDQLAYDITVWAGSNDLVITILDDNGGQKTAKLKVRLADDENVGFDVVATDGIYKAENIPFRTVLIEASTPNNEFGSAAVIGGLVSNITLFLTGVSDSPSEIDNNDFSQGLLGWEINGGGTASIIPEVD